MWNISAYQPLLLVETLLALRKWHKIINTQPYQQWRHSLASQNVNQDQSQEQNQQLNQELATAQKIRKHIDAIVRNYPTKFNCMRRCLALKSMLEKRHIACTMHIGIKIDKQSNKGGLDAHSWVSMHGVLINDSDDRIAEYSEITQSHKMFAALVKN